jgi:hypothetical protein
MKRLVCVVALIAAGLFDHVAHAEDEASTECFSSPEAVHEAHPGSGAIYTTHATWWTESPKCWFVGKPLAKPTAKPRIAAAVAPAPSQHAVQPRPLQPKQAIKATYEEAAASLHALMFDPDEFKTAFEKRFSTVGNTRVFDLWRRCFASPAWDLCNSAT